MRKGKRRKPHLVFKVRRLEYHNRRETREQRNAQDSGQCSTVGQNWYGQAAGASLELWYSECLRQVCGGSKNKVCNYISQTLHVNNAALTYTGCDVTNLQKLVLRGIRELFIKCVLQCLGNEPHTIPAGEHNKSNFCNILFLCCFSSKHFTWPFIFL